MPIDREIPISEFLFQAYAATVILSTHQGQNLSRSFLNYMSEFVVEEGNMSQVNFQLVLLQEKVRAQLVSVRS